MCICLRTRHLRRLLVCKHKWGLKVIQESIVRSVCVCVCPTCSDAVDLGIRNRNQEYLIKVVVQTCDSSKVKIIKFKFLNRLDFRITLSALSVLRECVTCVYFSLPGALMSKLDSLSHTHAQMVVSLKRMASSALQLKSCCFKLLFLIGSIESLEFFSVCNPPVLP